MNCTAFVVNKICHLGSDYGASVLLYTIVYVLNMSIPHNVMHLFATQRLKKKKKKINLVPENTCCFSTVFCVKVFMKKIYIDVQINHTHTHTITVYSSFYRGNTGFSSHWMSPCFAALFPLVSTIFACVTWWACFYSAYVSITPHYTYSSDEISSIALCVATCSQRGEVPTHTIEQWQWCRRREGCMGEAGQRRVGWRAWWRDGVKTDMDIYTDTAGRGGVTSLSQWLFVSQGIPWLAAVDVRDK